MNRPLPRRQQPLKYRRLRLQPPHLHLTMNVTVIVVRIQEIREGIFRERG